MSSLDEISPTTALEAPLTAMQQGMLYAVLQAAPDAGVYVEQVVCRCEAPLEVARFRAACETVLPQHDALQIGFDWQGREDARQFAAEALPVPFAVIDWTRDAPADPQAALATWLEKDRARGFAPDAPPLYRITVFDAGDAGAWWVWTVSHLVVDGRAMALVVSEVAKVYAAGDATSLAPRHKFLEYARAAAACEIDTDFWRAQLGDVEEPVRLQFRGGQGDGAVYHSVHCELRAELGSRMREHAPRHAVTETVLCHAAWALVLARHTGLRATVFGATKSLRAGAGLGNYAVGLYINTLPMRVDIDDNASTKSFLKAIGTRWLQLRAQESAPVAATVRCAGIPPHETLFNTYVVVERGDFDTLARREGSIPAAWRFQLLERTPAPVTLAVYLGAPGEVVLEYDAALLPAAAAERLLAEFVHALDQLAQEVLPDTVAKIEVVPPEERAALLALAHTPPPERVPNVVDAIEAQAAVRGDVDAVVYRDDRLSYRELNRRANALAAVLQARGIGADALVGLVAPRTRATFIAILGILKAGAGYVPLDPAYPAERLQYMLAQSGTTVVVAEDAAIAASLGEGIAVVAPEGHGELDTPPPRAIAPEHAAYVIFTSGSTGQPKGVVITHGNLAHFTAAGRTAYGFQAEDRLLQFSSLSFDAAIEEIFGAWCVGATLVLRTEEMLGSTAAFLEAATQHGITVFDMTTAFWHVLAEGLPSAPVPSTLRSVLFGGEAARADRLALWQQHAPQVVQLNTYGPTETTVVCTVADLTQAPAVDPLSIGKALPGLAAYVLDAAGRLAPFGAAGELCIAGPQLARGYLQRPEETAKRFITAHALPGAPRVYRTGDRVQLDESGDLYYLGRIDRQLKVRGFRVEPEEIERAIMAEPEVREAVVVVRGDSPAETQLDAYWTSGTAAEPEGASQALRAAVAARLPAYLVPASFTWLAAIPLTPSGKLNRRALPKPALPETPESSLTLTEDEARMAELWQAVLRVGAVAPEDNFFALGGHSLAAILLLGRVEEAFGKRVAPVTLYRHPALRAFTHAVVSGAEPEKHRAMHTIQKGRGGIPLVFIGSTDMIPPLLKTLGPDQPLYSLNIFGLLPEDGTVPQWTLADIATRYCAQLRAVVPRGPYVLAGYCRDAMLALELARQLEAASAPVARVIAIDYFWTSQPRYSRLWRHVRNLALFGGGYIQRKIRERRKAWQEQRGRRLSRRAVDTAQAAQQDAGRYQTTLYINMYYDAAEAYRPEAIDTPITNILAGEWGLNDVPEFHALTRGGVNTHVVRASHYNLWDEPQVQTLARAIQDELRTVAREHR